MGATNCGKTTVIDHICEQYDNYHAVLVGKKMRAMFPPNYFEGQAAPAKTDELAFSLMMEGIEESGDDIPIIDGQPRNQVQLEWCKEKVFNTYDCRFVVLWAPRHIREARARGRDMEESQLALSLQRMDSDQVTLFDIILQMQHDNLNVKVVYNYDTDVSMVAKEINDFVESRL